MVVPYLFFSMTLLPKDLF